MPKDNWDDDWDVPEGVDPYNLTGRDPTRSIWKDGKRPSPDYYEILNEKKGQLMPEQITLEEALKLVTFYQGIDGTWRIKDVKSDVIGNVEGNVCGDIHCSVGGTVHGSVWGGVKRNVWGRINDRKWQFVETPKEKFQRLLEEKGDQKLIDAFNQLEDNDD